MKNYSVFPFRVPPSGSIRLSIYWIVLLLACLAFSPSAAQETEEREWGITFWLSQYGEFGGGEAAAGFYWISEDGTNLTQLVSYAELVHTGTYHRLSDISPDGQQVLYMSPFRGEPPEIFGDTYSFNRITKESKQIIPENGQGNTEPIWSPDGRYIAFLYGDGIRQHGSFGIEIFDLQNHTISSILNLDSQLFDNSLDDVFWSRDSKTLAITGTREISRGAGPFSDYADVIWIYGADGTYINEIPSPPGNYVGAISFRDESLYVSYGEWGTTEISAVDIVSRKITSLLNAAEIASGIKRFTSFNIHPEQEMLAVAVTNQVQISPGTERDRLFIYDMVTGDATELSVPMGNISFIRWMQRPATV